LDTTLRFRTISFKGSSTEAFKSSVNSYQGKRYFSLTSEELLRYLTAKHPDVLVQKVEMQFPDKLIITSLKRTPLAYLAVSEGYMLLSEDSHVLQKTRDINSIYPVLTYYQRIPYHSQQVGDEITFQEVKDSLFFLDMIKRSRRTVNRIDIVSYYMLGLYTEEETFYFSSEKDRDLQKYQFEQAISQFEINGEPFRVLDLRFQKPIVKWE